MKRAAARSRTCTDARSSTCPYCGARDAEGIRLPRRRDLRGRRPDAARWKPVYDYVYLRDNPRGAHARILASRRRLPALAGGRRATRNARSRAVRACDFAAEAPAHDAVPAFAGRPDRSRRAARVQLRRRDITGLSPATRSPRRCSPTASSWSGRSFKFHRPRGIFGAGAEEPNALVELRAGARREPNTRATTTELYDGLDARAARTTGPRSNSTCWRVNGLLVAVLRRRLLLQDFHVAEELLGEVL